MSKFDEILMLANIAIITAIEQNNMSSTINHLLKTVKYSDI